MKVFNVLKKVSFLLLVVVICSFTSNNTKPQTKENKKPKLVKKFICITYEYDLNSKFTAKARQCLQGNGVKFVQLKSKNIFYKTELWEVIIIPIKTPLLGDGDDNGQLPLFYNLINCDGIISISDGACHSNLFNIKN